MLNYTQILEYAVKGINAEIEQLEKDVKQGYKFIEQIENGEKVKTPKTKYEIYAICRKKKEQIEKLNKERFELSFELSELEEKKAK